MKPQVFLSHAKENRDFIERLANDLRVGRVAVWVDEWEIPPGESFRRQIFEDGVPNSDLFFVYLTPASAESYWVQRELDAAFVRDAESRGGFISTFVDSDETRKSLSVDLQALNSPVLNSELYERPIRQLIARAWEGLLLRRVEASQEERQVRVLELQRDNAELRARIAQLEAAGAIEAADITSLIIRLESTTYELGGQKFSLAELFARTANIIATGTNEQALVIRVGELTSLKTGPSAYQVGNYYSHDFLGPLIIAGLVRVQSFEASSDYYYLTD